MPLLYHINRFFFLSSTWLLVGIFCLLGLGDFRLIDVCVRSCVPIQVQVSVSGLGWVHKLGEPQNFRKRVQNVCDYCISGTAGNKVFQEIIALI